MSETVWLVTDDNQAVADWIDANLVGTTYTFGQRAIIVIVADEADWMMFRLRWAY